VPKPKRKVAEVSELDRLADAVPDWLVEEHAGEGFGNWHDEWKGVPPWNDEKAQATYFYERLILGWSRFYPPNYFEEKAAVEAALHGKPEKLMEMIRPIDGQPNPKITKLTANTWELLIELATGERNPLTGVLKGKGPGRAPLSIEELRDDTHLAAEAFKILRDALPIHYPKQTKADIGKRALELAGKMYGVESNTIRNYLDQPKTRRRRPYRAYGYEEE